MTAEPTGPSVAVLGGGVAGLTAAHTLHRERPDLRIVVLEGAERPGGKLLTAPVGGHPVDLGADAFLARVPEAVDLCRELGLDDELVSPASRNALVLRDGSLRPLPEGLVLGVPTDLDALRASGLVSEDALTAVAADLRRTDPPDDTDRSVGAYVRSHLGDEVFDTLVSPLLSGINAGSPDELSLHAGAPQLAAASRAGGSLVGFARELRAEADPAAPVFHSLRGGAGALTHRLADELGDQVVTRTIVDGIVAAERSGYGVTVLGTDGRRASIAVDAVVVALPAYSATEVLRPLSAPVADDLAQLDYASVAIVIARFARDRVGHALDGSGYLVPPEEGLLTTAASFGSVKWPAWADDDQCVIRFSVGRHHDRRADDLDDPTLRDEVLREARGPLGLEGPPEECLVVRWPRSLPQFRPGHLERVAGWHDTLATDAPGVVLAGAALGGLGVPACVGTGRRAAAAVLERL